MKPNVIYWLEKSELEKFVYVHSRSFLNSYNTLGKSAEMIESEIYLEHIYITKKEFTQIIDSIFDYVPIKPVGVGLELGAGCGALSIEISKRYPGIKKIWAVEIVPEITEIAMCELIEINNASKVIPVVGSFDEIELGDGEVDWIVEFDSLHHSFNLKKTLNEASRVLKKDGILIAIDRAHWKTSKKRRLELENVTYSKEFLLKRGWDEKTEITRAENGEHEHLLSDYITAFREAGFKDVNWLALLNPSFETMKLSLISSIPSRFRRNTKFHYVEFWPIWVIFPTVIFMKIFKRNKFGNFINLPRGKNSNRFQLKTVIVATK